MIERECPKTAMLKVCRLTYVLIDELVKDKDQKEECFKLVDKAVEEIHGKRENRT